MASEVTLRRHSKRELLAMVERGLAVQEELWRLQEQHEVRGEIVAEQADQLAACRDEVARLTAALAAQGREVAALQEEIERWQTSTMLVNGHGDAEGITPKQNERNVNQLMAEVEACEARTQALARAFSDVEPRLVVLLRDQEVPMYACAYCHAVGEGHTANVSHQPWCLVTVASAALAAPPQRPATGEGA